MGNGQRGVCSAVIAMLALSSAQAQTAVPVHREPRHHLVWEDGHVRVLDVKIAPGDTTLFHTHDTAILYVPIAVSPISSQALGGAWSGSAAQTASRFRLDATASDTTYVARPLTHRVANIGIGPFRLIAITNAHTTSASVTGADPAPPGVVERTSTWYRQTRLTLDAHATSAWFTSRVPVVVVQPANGQLTIEGNVASSSNALDAPGSWAYIRANERFRVRNDGSAASTIVFVQAR